MDPREHASAILNILEDLSEDKVRLEAIQRAMLNLLGDLSGDKSHSERALHAIYNVLEDFSEDKGQLEQTQRAMLNLLGDLSGDKRRSEKALHAIYNVLEDFSVDKGRLEQTQRAMLNLLGDLSGDKGRLEETQHAIFNLLEDFGGDKERLEDVQRAMLNLLQDFDAERLRSEGVSRELMDSNQLLRLAKEAVERSNHELESFSYSVSHDLRAPLRHILGFANILNEQYGPSLVPEAQHHLDRIRRGTERMGHLIDDLLSLSRLGRQGLRFEATSLEVIVNEVIAEAAPETAQRQVEWEIRELPTISCDPGLIRQVFQNLVSNALKFTRTRKRSVIEIGEERTGQNTVLYVRDNGVGFSMKYADKLFGVFQRLHRAEDFEGTGVGLATVQRIIQKHGGRIWAEAELDKGASFYFTLGNPQTSEADSKAMAAGEKS